MYLTSSMGEPQTPALNPSFTPRLMWARTTAGMKVSCFHLRDTAPRHLYQSAGDGVGACGMHVRGRGGVGGRF